QGVEMIAGSRLGDLVEQGVDVAKHDRLHRGAPGQFLPEKHGGHPETRAWNLDVNAGWRSVIAQHERQAYDTLVADGSDFGSLVVGHGVYERADAGLDEVDKLDLLACLIKRFPVFERHRFKMLAKTFVVLRREQAEQPVCGRIGAPGSCRHSCCSFLAPKWARRNSVANRRSSR